MGALARDDMLDIDDDTCPFQTGVIYFPIKLGKNAWRRFCQHKFKLDKHDTSSITKMNGNICVRRQLPIPAHHYRYIWKAGYTLIAVVFCRCFCCGPCLSPHYCRYNGLTLIFFFISVVDSMKAALELMIEGVRIGDEL